MHCGIEGNIDSIMDNKHVLLIMERLIKQKYLIIIRVLDYNTYRQPLDGKSDLYIVGDAFVVTLGALDYLYQKQS